MTYMAVMQGYGIWSSLKFTIFWSHHLLLTEHATMPFWVTNVKHVCCRLCIQDCTTALAQMEATMSSFAGSSNAAAAMHSSMIKLLTRRAAAQAELHDFASVKTDVEEVCLRHR